MMYLLDTHAFLWFVFDDPRLSDRAADLIEDAGHELWLSYASIWEISIKHSLGKLKFDDPLDSRNQFFLCPQISPGYAVTETDS